MISSKQLQDSQENLSVSNENQIPKRIYISEENIKAVFVNYFQDPTDETAFQVFTLLTQSDGDLLDEFLPQIERLFENLAQNEIIIKKSNKILMSLLEHNQSSENVVSKLVDLNYINYLINYITSAYCSQVLGMIIDSQPSIIELVSDDTIENVLMNLNQENDFESYLAFLFYIEDTNNERILSKIPYFIEKLISILLISNDPSFVVAIVSCISIFIGKEYEITQNLDEAQKSSQILLETLQKTEYCSDYLQAQLIFIRFCGKFIDNDTFSQIIKSSLESDSELVNNSIKNSIFY